MVQQRADRDLILQRKTEIALQQPAEPVQVTAEQRLIQPVQRPQLGGALRGQVDVAVDKVTGRQGEDAKNQQGSQQQHRDRLQQTAQDKISHREFHRRRPEWRGGVRALRRRFDVRQAADQSVIDIRF